MPVLMSPDMAAKFKERWLTAHPEDQGTTPCSDDSLTSLHWLQNFSILNAYPERAAATSSQHHHLHHHMHHLHHLKPPGCPGAGTDSPSSPPAGDTAATGMPVCLGSPVTSVSDCARFAGYAHPGTTGSGYRGPVQGAPQPGLDIDYKTNPKVKPPFSYASLICMAMQASQQPKVTLSTIYNWITDNFCYYRHAEPSWQNSIRHNLSLNKCFMKVPRQKDEPGKGGFWQIDPQYADMFVNGIFKRRRMSANHYSGGSAQRQAKLLQGQESPYHRVQNGCPYQGGSGGASNRRKHLAAKHGGKEVRAPKSPLLGTEARGANVLRGDFDLTSVFDDVLGGNCSNFEDLDINTALSSLGCEMEVSIQGRQHPAAGLGRWCTGDGELQSHGQPPSNHHPSYGYMELDCSINMADLHLHHPHHLHQDQMLVQAQQHPLHQFEEPVALFPEQPEEVVIHPWEEIKEEAQVIPLTLDQGFGLCEGFFSEMQPWERVETYL